VIGSLVVWLVSRSVGLLFVSLVVQPADTYFFFGVQQGRQWSCEC